MVPARGGRRRLPPGPDPRCPSCDLSLRKLLSARRAGCALCYRAFAVELAPLLRVMQGRSEPGAARRWRRTRALKARLDEAVLTERFEEAARLRDRLARARARAA